MKLNRLKQLLLTFFITSGAISCSSSDRVKVIDSITKRPVAGANVAILSAFQSPFYVKFYFDRAVSDESGQAVIERRGFDPRRLIVMKDGYHPYILKDNTIQIKPTIELCRFDDPLNLNVVEKSVFIDTPGNANARRFEWYDPHNPRGNDRIYISNESPPNSANNEVLLKLPLTVLNAPAEAQVVFAIKFKVRPIGPLGGDIASISVVDGTIESHGNDLSLFNCLRSVNPSRDSVNLTGRTAYTFATKRGVYGKLYVFSILPIGSNSGLGVDFSMGYVANHVNELELKSTYDGLRLNSEETLFSEAMKSGSSDIL